MSTRYDILDAREAVLAHMSVHRCGDLTECVVRRQLRQTHMTVAGRWGIDTGDDTRQREQFHARTSTGSATS